MSDEVERSQDLMDAMRGNPTDAELEELRDLLDAETPAARRNAIEGLRAAEASRPGALMNTVTQLVENLDESDWSVRNSAASALSTAANIDVSAVSEAVPPLADRLDDETYLVRRSALMAFLRIALAEPDTVEPYVDDVIPFLDSEHEEVQDLAIRFLNAVAVEHPNAVEPVTDRLVEFLRDGAEYEPIQHGFSRSDLAQWEQAKIDEIESGRLKRHRNIRQEAGHAIVQIASAEPAAIASHVEDIADVIDDPDYQVRRVASNAIFALATDRPEVVSPYVERIGERLADDVETVQGSASQALAVLALDYPAAVVGVAAEHPSQIRSLLDHDDAPVRGAAATLLSFLADEDPSVIEPVTDRLQELRDGDDAQFVREAAADALPRTG